MTAKLKIRGAQAPMTGVVRGPCPLLPASALRIPNGETQRAEFPVTEDAVEDGHPVDQEGPGGAWRRRRETS